MFAIKQKAAVVAAAGALVLAVPAVSGAAILPGFGGPGPAAPPSTPVSSVIGSNSGVLGPAGPLGKNGPLRGGGCLAPGVNPNSLGPDGPLGPGGPLGLGGIGANLNCSSNGLFGFSPFSWLSSPFSLFG